ncbi:MAG: hypothetical protein WAO54_08550 [Eubacteriales bacterium]|jgi:DNA-binding response OmpR family regulator
MKYPRIVITGSNFALVKQVHKKLARSDIFTTIINPDDIKKASENVDLIILPATPGCRYADACICRRVSLKSGVRIVVIIGKDAEAPSPLGIYADIVVLCDEKDAISTVHSIISRDFGFDTVELRGGRMLVDTELKEYFYNGARFKPTPTEGAIIQFLCVYSDAPVPAERIASYIGCTSSSVIVHIHAINEKTRKITGRYAIDNKTSVGYFIK